MYHLVYFSLCIVCVVQFTKSASSASKQDPINDKKNNSLVTTNTITQVIQVESTGHCDQKEPHIEPCIFIDNILEEVF